MTGAHMMIGVGDDVIDEHVLQAGHVTGPCGVEEGREQLIGLRRSSTLVPLLGEVYARSPP
jgi:hypothetical protein